jgi:hypothetical protein
MLPKNQEIEIRLLATLEKLGGKAKPHDVYATVTQSFPRPDCRLFVTAVTEGGNSPE